MEKLFPQFVLTPEQLEAIGCVAVTAAHIENYLERLLSTICGIDHAVSQALVKQPMIDRACDLLSDVAKIILTDSIKQERFCGKIGDLKHANTERNSVIHSVWLPDPRDFNLPAVGAKGNKSTNRKTITADEIMRVANNLSRNFDELHQVALETWPSVAWLNKFSAPTPPL